MQNQNTNTNNSQNHLNQNQNSNSNQNQNQQQNQHHNQNNQNPNTQNHNNQKPNTSSPNLNSNQKPVESSTNQTENSKKSSDKNQDPKEGDSTKKPNSVIGWVILAIVISGLIVLSQKKQAVEEVDDSAPNEQVSMVKGETYTYTMHDISLVLPAGFIPEKLEVSSVDASKYTDYQLPEGAGTMRYIADIKYWDQNEKRKLSYEYKGTKKIGNSIFAVYDHRDGEVVSTYYLYQIGNTGYRFLGNSTTDELLKTFKYTKWADMKKTGEIAPVTPSTQAAPATSEKISDPATPVKN